MSDKDELDEFFNEVNKEGESFSAINVQVSDEEENESKKITSFSVLTEDNSDQKIKNFKDKNFDNEPEYVLQPDHSKINYPPYKSNYAFSLLEAELKKSNKESVLEFKENNEIWTSLDNINPILSFDCFLKQTDVKYIAENLEKFLQSKGITKPTPVQSQALPFAFYGYDLSVISQTGTGKTLCFLIPLLFHVNQRGKCKTPVGLIISTTEILANQTYDVLNELIKGTDINCVKFTSDSLKYKQLSSIEKGIDIIIATPGRLIRFLTKIDWINLTYFVVDEADRIFEEGFFRQLRSIWDYIRPRRQTLLFGATLPYEIQELYRNSLKSPVLIQVGKIGKPQENIDHNFLYFNDPSDKRVWLKQNVHDFKDKRVLIFTNNTSFCNILYSIIREEIDDSIPVSISNSKMSIADRGISFDTFKKNDSSFLISTDISCRGIDIDNINVVINFDAPDEISTYIHRVGRTGRAGKYGTAYTLLFNKDLSFAEDLLQHFFKSNVEPPESLQNILEQNQ